MALTEEQIDAVNDLLTALDAEVNMIVEAREDVRAVVRIDTLRPDAIVDDMTLIQALKTKASVAANNLVGLLA